MSMDSVVQGVLCVEMPDGKVPDWVDLLPAGPVIRGNDGRGWRLDDPEAVIQATRSVGRDPVVDWEHATMRRWGPASKAPAAGWIKELRVRDGIIQGRVEWTSKGRASVADREYRYISPVFDHQRGTGQIIRLVNAALTNMPNLTMRSLNREIQTEGAKSMNEHERICQSLGLSTDATTEQVLAAICKIQTDLETASNREEKDPPLDRFVPRSDYDRALDRATAAETALAESNRSARDAEIEAALDEALEAGKITPSTVEYHRAQCQAEGGLERFREFVKLAPEIAGASGMEGRQARTAQNQAEPGDAEKIRRMFGNTEEALDKYSPAS